MTDESPVRPDLKAVWKSQPQELSPMALEQLRGEALRLQRRSRRVMVREILAAGVVIVVGGLYVRYLPGALIKAGSALMILWALYYVWLVRRMLSPRRVPDAAGACLDFHRRELERRLRLARDAWKWALAPAVPVFVLMGIGRWTGPPPPGRSTFADHLIILVIGALLIESLVLMFLWTRNRADKWRDRIDELDELGRRA